MKYATSLPMHCEWGRSSRLWSERFRAAPRDLQQVSYWHAIFNTHGELGMCSGYWCCFPNWLCLGLCTPAVEFWWKWVLENGSEQPVFSWITGTYLPLPLQWQQFLSGCARWHWDNSFGRASPYTGLRMQVLKIGANGMCSFSSREGRKPERFTVRMNCKSVCWLLLICPG